MIKNKEGERRHHKDKIEKTQRKDGEEEAGKGAVDDNDDDVNNDDNDMNGWRRVEWSGKR